MFDRRWLGDEFESLPGLFADFDANGRLRRFGRRDELCQVEVVVHPPQATTREVPDDDLLPEEWLDGWRHNLLEQARNLGIDGPGEILDVRLAAHDGVSFQGQCAA